MYVIYVSGSKDDNILECVKSAIDTAEVAVAETATIQKNNTCTV